MIKYVWTFLGFGGTASERKVVGGNTPVDGKEVAYYRESSARLEALHRLVVRYRGTPHEPKLKAVFDKTRTIHAYLVGKKRPHELELFHVQHTDHFINTFTVILDVHQSHQAVPLPPFPPPLPPPPPVVSPRTETRTESKADVLLKRFEAERVRKSAEPAKQPEMVRPLSGQGQLVDTLDSRMEVPRLAVPAISIATYSNIIYLREHNTEGQVAHEVGFTSTNEEKGAFLLHVSARLGLNVMGMAYYGNALMTIPNSSGSTPTGYVPVINWKGCTYALNLNDYRLFPVKVPRRSS
ncbi:hypothetical protein BH24BAC1_BH24BAC1_06520 [soil metagenome]